MYIEVRGPLRVTSRRKSVAGATSAFRGRADEIRHKADVRALTSGAEGRADHLGGTSGRGIVAKCRLSQLHNGNRTLAHRDAGDGGRPLHHKGNLESYIGYGRPYRWIAWQWLCLGSEFPQQPQNATTIGLCHKPIPGCIKSDIARREEPLCQHDSISATIGARIRGHLGNIG
jgi:hypothetical protein